jgi:putative ATPase
MEPLAERMRPRNADEFIGQEHLMGKEGILRRAAESGHLPSFILWGPPGTGKTTMTRILASLAGLKFIPLSAIRTGVGELKEIISEAEKNFFHTREIPLVFIDEIHRFNKAQQDYLLGAVEKGTIILCGATTENPSFEINRALLSRCRVFTLQPLGTKELKEILHRAITKDGILSQRNIMVQEYEELFRLSGGDARKLLNVTELITTICPQKNLVITNELVRRIIQENLSAYDKAGEMHYDVISAFIKSVRGSDPNAALYYLARMLEGGEDILFIARRMVILAAEDIGLANPNALLLAQATFQAVHQIGMPEARIILSQCAIYLASSPKSNSAYLAIDKAIETVRNTGNIPVPLHLRNAPTSLMKELNYGKDYLYPHDFPNHYVNQSYLPEELKNISFYTPADNPREQELNKYLLSLKNSSASNNHSSS